MSDETVDRFADQVGVAIVAGVFLDHVDEDEGDARQFLRAVRWFLPASAVSNLARARITASCQRA